MTTTYAIRVDEELKEEATSVANSFGLDLASATRLMWTQMCKAKSMKPFFDFDATIDSKAKTPYRGVMVSSKNQMRDKDQTYYFDGKDWGWNSNYGWCPLSYDAPNSETLDSINLADEMLHDSKTKWYKSAEDAHSSFNL